MKTPQTSPNGGGWEWGLKNPTQIKIFLLRFYNLPVGIQPFNRTFEKKHETFYYQNLCKKGEWFTFIWKPLFKHAKGEKKKMEKIKKEEAKEGWNKGEGGEKGRKKNMKLKSKEGKNRAAS